MDPYTGPPRQLLPNDAINFGDAGRIAAFFNSYRQAARGSGTQASPARGHRPPTEKPIYRHAQIAELYARHRKGAYAGREAEWARQEADIFAAQREGRIQGTPYLTK